MVEPKIHLSINDDAVSILYGQKVIAIESKGRVPVIHLTNEHGNSIEYEISDTHGFDNLLANLWQFVKDSQH